jgi:tRNA (cytidine/uridine-2'-O-)-methyltransferase
MFYVVLFQPEIPPNTGNIIRLCSNTGAQLHLVKPLGFQLDDRQLRRADSTTTSTPRCGCTTTGALAGALAGSRVPAFSTRGGCQRYDAASYGSGDAFRFDRRPAGRRRMQLQDSRPSNA